MFFDARTYNVLVVSASEKFNASFRSLLREAYHYKLTFVRSAASAKRSVLENDFDFVIVNMPLPDEGGTRLSIDACSEKGTVCLLLCKAEQYEETRVKVMDFGVFTLPKPISASMLLQAMSWLEAARERLRRVEKKSVSMEDKMAEIRLVNRAKWALIEQRSMTENEAHRFIEKQAMDQCVTRREIAERILHDPDSAL